AARRSAPVVWPAPWSLPRPWLGLPVDAQLAQQRLHDSFDRVIIDGARRLRPVARRRARDHDAQPVLLVEALAAVAEPEHAPQLEQVHDAVLVVHVVRD